MPNSNRRYQEPRQKPGNLKAVRRVKCEWPQSILTDTTSHKLPLLEYEREYDVVDVVFARDGADDMYVIKIPDARGPEKTAKFSWKRFSVVE